MSQELETDQTQLSVTSDDPPLAARKGMKRQNKNSANPLKRYGPWVALIGMTIAAFVALFSICYLLITDNVLFRKIVDEHVRAVVGVPMAAVSAFLVVFILESRAGTIEFEIFKVKFRGASGPVVLWVFTFLSFVLGIWLLW